MPTIKFSSSFYSQLGLKSWYRREPFLKSSSVPLEQPLEHPADQSIDSELVSEKELPNEAAKHESDALEKVSSQEKLPVQTLPDKEVIVLEEGNNNFGVDGVIEVEDSDAAEQLTHQVETDRTSRIKAEEKQQRATQDYDASHKPNVENQDLFPDEIPAVNKSQPNNDAIVLIGRGLDSIWENDDEVAWRLWQNIVHAFGWKEKNVVFFDLDCLVSEDAVFSTMEEVIDLSVESVLVMDTDHILIEQLAEGVHVVEVPDLESMLSDPYAKQAFYQTVISQF